MLRRIAIIAAFVVAGLGVLAIRAIVEGRAALDVGDRASRDCLPAYDARPANAPSINPAACLVAIDAYETAARWYVPLAPHVRDAYLGMRVIAAHTDPATAPKGDADPATALAAWRGIRSAARATRSLWTPHRADLDAADAAIARLSAADPAAGNAGGAATSSGGAATSSGGAATSSGGAATSSGGAATSSGGTATSSGGAATSSGAEGSGAATPDDTALRELWHETRLARDVRPSIGAGALAGLGVLLWLGGVIVLIRKGLDRAGAWVRRPAVTAGAAIVLGVVLWFVGLANA